MLTLPYLDHLADYDEFYTLLAARGWLETGAPVIADGAYTRAISFTVLQAAFFSVFGESMVVARLPSLLAVMALAAGLFIWVRHVAGAWAATLTAVIFACTPLTIQMGQFSRFYALHALTAGAMALLAYYACLATGRRRVALAAGGLVCLAWSMNLQSTTVIALCAIGLWMTAAVMNHLLVRARTWRGRALIAASLLGLVAVGCGRCVAQRHRRDPLERISIDDSMGRHTGARRERALLPSNARSGAGASLVAVSDCRSRSSRESRQGDAVRRGIRGHNSRFAFLGRPEG